MAVIINSLRQKVTALNPFGSISFNVQIDTIPAISSVVEDLLNQARNRQKDNPETMCEHTVLRHLVGATLQMLMEYKQEIEHSDFSATSELSDRNGDFIVGNTVIHVVAIPTELLINKCLDNLHSGYHPFIITVLENISATRSLIGMKYILRNVEIMNAEQFVSTNVYKWSGFDSAKHKGTLEKLLIIYNQLIDTYETDPSLKVSLN